MSEEVLRGDFGVHRRTALVGVVEFVECVPCGGVRENRFRGDVCEGRGTV